MRALLLLTALVLGFACLSEALEGKQLDKAISNLPGEKLQKSHKKFRLFDKNNDHHIDAVEFKQGLKALGNNEMV